MADRDALADLRAEIHLWTGDESTPVDLRVLRAAAEEIERLRAAAAQCVGRDEHGRVWIDSGNLHRLLEALENDRG